jgi:septum formation protein
MTGGKHEIILASASLSRRRLLEAAGIACRAVPSGIDEEAIKGADLRLHELPLELAKAKGLAISEQIPAAIVIGADQILVCDGERFDRPRTVEAAGDQLKRLRGKTHELKTAVSCALEGSIQWSHTEDAWLTMRNFSDEWLRSYLAAEGAGLADSVGGYKLEERGIQLFSRIEGDYFAILGLPLLPLLEFLRSREAIPA